jgi:hypothetical protein
MLKVFIQANAWAALAEDASERRLANLDWFAPHVGAVQFQQIEGEEEGARLVPALA